MPSGAPEVFASVQGEGASAGTPSVFVRLSECSLKCGFCDTKYTWDWAQHDRAREQVELGVEAVVERAVALAPRNAVITGGEPMLQPEALAALAEALHGRGFRIEIETSGTITPRPELARWIDQWNVSPKLASSGNSEKARRRIEPLTWFAAAPNAYFKFVIIDPADVEEAAQIVEAFGVPAERVILMPEGTDAATLEARSRWLAERCVALGYRLGTRLHVLLWGPERGR